MKVLGGQEKEEKMPPHVHEPETCARFGCRVLEKEFSKAVFDTGDFLNDKLMMERFSKYVNRILLANTFTNCDSNVLKQRYNAYLEKAYADEEAKLSFYERQQIDHIIKEGKEE